MAKEQAKGQAGGRRRRGYGRSAVSLHREGWYGDMRPAVNVKVYGWLGSVDYDALRRVNGTGMEVGMVPAWFDWEWIEKNVSESVQQEAWEEALRSGWEQMQEDASECFASVPGTRRHKEPYRGKPGFEPGVRVWAEGRSGGWAIVEGLPEWDTGEGDSEGRLVGGWDAVMLGRWRRFEKLAREGAAGVPSEAALILAGWAIEALERGSLEEYTG